MSSTIFIVPAGTTGTFAAPARTSVCVQPTSGGTASLSYGPGGAGGSFTPGPQGANTGAFSFCTDTYASVMGNIGQIQVAAATQPATVIISDLSQYPGSFPERMTVAQSGVAFTSIAANTTELTLFSIRFPAGFLKPNFMLDWAAQFTLTNNANVKTLKSYFGISTNSATAAALEGGTVLTSNVYTSMIGAHVAGRLFGRNDNQAVIAANPGLISAGGWGSSVTANVALASQNYSGPAAVEQVFYITGTKATGADTFTLDGIVVEIRQ